MGPSIVGDRIVFPQASNDRQHSANYTEHGKLTSSLAEQAAIAGSFLRSAWPDSRERVRKLDLDGTEIEQVLLCGCGDSHHAAYSLGHAFRRWTGRSAGGFSAMALSRYLLPERAESRNERTLLVGVSVSGETARTIEALELGKQAGMRTMAVTNAVESSIAQVADESLSYSLPSTKFGPGLLNYLASMLSGYALASSMARKELRAEVDRTIQALPDKLDFEDHQRGIDLADRLDLAQPIVFLGSGPAYGSAMFAAAKVVEAAGHPSWAQDVEEWAHVEYFIARAEAPVWMLRTHGRAASRELEVIQAARALGRDLVVSEPPLAAKGWELLAPLVQWVGPVGLADGLTARLDEQPFRGFGGGRSRAEGGGASRIRSSERLQSFDDLRNDSLGN
jgi:glucosamine--fructose-6-phosphate aminotransferase (isomerizing)